MFSQCCITNGVAPVDQPLLLVVVHFGQPGRYRSEIGGIARGSRQGILREIVVGIVRGDAPVSAGALAGFIGIDQDAFAQAANLVIDDFEIRTECRAQS